MSRQEIERTASRRRLPSPSTPAPPLEEEDLLEILVRLSPLPSTLPRASAVCARWRRLISDPGFFRRFRLHHRPDPPLLGFFVADPMRRLLGFGLLMDAPNRVPTNRFSMEGKEGGQMLSCRHGLVLIFLGGHVYQFLVWDPVTGVRHFIDPSPAQRVSARVNGAVLRDAIVDDHFKVVLLAVEGPQAFACVYSSETGDWGNLVSAFLPPKVSMVGPPAMKFSKMHSLLVGDSLYWLLSDKQSLAEVLGHAPCSSSILEFDLEKQSLTVERVPADLQHTKDREISVITNRSGGLGLLTLSGCNAHFWKRNNESDGDASWVLGRTIQLDNIPSLNPHKDAGYIFIKGFAEYNHVVLLSTPSYLYMVQLEPLEVRRFLNVGSRYHAFESVYTIGNGGEPDAADVPQNT